MPRVPCPYCLRRQPSREALRTHVATNACGQVPEHVVLAYTPGEAKETHERQFQRTVAATAKAEGWRMFHVERSQVKGGRWVTNTGGDPGVPDLWMVRAGQLLVIELKAKGGRPRPGQAEWIAELDQVPGVTAIMGATPADWPTIQALLTTPVQHNPGRVPASDPTPHQEPAP